MKNGLIAENLTQNYSSKEILRGVSLTANVGECVGIAGRNGSGKSTLLAILSGMKKPASGTLSLFGRDLLKDRGAFGELIGYVPQTNPLFEELTVEDNLKLLNGKAIRKDDPVLKSMELDDLFHVRVSKLSGGMKRRLAIASALADHPPVLIMDEPTSALDLYHKSVIYNYLKEYVSKDGIVIMATHDFEEMNLCSRLYLMQNGLAALAKPEEAVNMISTKEDYK